MINQETHQELQYFVGKPCTVITPPMALELNGEKHTKWFTVNVLHITREAIYGEDPQQKTLSAFFFPVIGIAEEAIVTEDDPKYEEIKDKIKNMKQKKQQQQQEQKQQELDQQAAMEQPMMIAPPLESAMSPPMYGLEELQQQAANLRKEMKDKE